MLMTTSSRSADITTKPYIRQAHHVITTNSCIGEQHEGRESNLDGFSDVDEGVANGDEEFVEATHLLHEDGVHALVVVGRVLPVGAVDVVVLGKFRQDVGSYFVHDLVCRLRPRSSLCFRLQERMNT